MAHSAIGCERLNAVVGSLASCRLRSALTLGHQLAIVRGFPTLAALEPKILAGQFGLALWDATAMRGLAVRKNGDLGKTHTHKRICAIQSATRRKEAHLQERANGHTWQVSKVRPRVEPKSPGLDPAKPAVPRP